MFAPVYGSYSNIAGKQEEIEMFDKLEDLLIRLEEILSELQEPDVASDPNRFRKLMKEQSELTPIVEAYKEYKACKQNIEESLELLNEESDEDMRELAKEELNESKARVEELEHELKILLLPKDPNDDKNVVVEIRAGAGGDEAALFAAEIYRMYLHYAESKRWKVELVECEEIGIGGMKNVTFMIDGQGAYSMMKYESGVHRVQRVPETESGGRIHTSTITVAVMPEAEDVDVHIDEKDIRIDVMRASGNGGQCVNTTDSAVRLTHYPTGIVIYSQTEKSQLQNKEKAFALLRAKLYDLECQKQHDAEAEARKSQIGTGDRRMGRMPGSRGMAVSSNGSVAMLEIRMVMTSSEGCSSPSCRFPIRRTEKITTKYKINARMKIVPMFECSFMIEIWEM